MGKNFKQKIWKTKENKEKLDKEEFCIQIKMFSDFQISDHILKLAICFSHFYTALFRWHTHTHKTKQDFSNVEVTESPFTYA